jgi:hypothetical protein
VSVDFTQVPAALLAEPGLTLTHVRVYAYIQMQTLGRPGWDLSYGQIAAGVGSSRRATAVEAVAWLVDHGWLIKEERPDAPNLYAICREPGVRVGAPPVTPGRTIAGTPDRTHQENHSQDTDTPGAPPAAPGPRDADVLPLGNVERTPKRRAAATPLPDGWKIGDDLATWTEGVLPGLPSSEYRRIYEGFRDHALANDRRQVDWDAAWRNWVRREASMRASRGRRSS